jgi:hypothetical protein
VSREFIEAGYNKRLIHEAATQERQLAYFTKSDMQEDYLTTEYITAWAERKYQTNDYFLNFVKSVFKTENFLTFFKYLREPLPSAKLINNRVAPQLRRVFNAENSEFKYVVDGTDEIDFYSLLGIREFEHDLFNAELFNHNSIVVSDVENGNPYRYFVDIKDVFSIIPDKYKDISKIAFKGSIIDDGIEVPGIVYIDEIQYVFFDKDYKVLKQSSHSLKHCPAHFINPKVVGKDWVIRESLFSYIREELEEYSFLKTIQKMTEPNGAIPVVTQLDVQIITDGRDHEGDEMEPGSNDMMASQRASMFSDNPPSGDGILQVGTIFKIPPIEKDGGGLDMEAVKNMINFHYIPVESLNYLKSRIQDIEGSIVYTLVGGIIDGLKEGSKNELQVEESLSVLQNTLIYFADSFNYIRKLSDQDMLMLKYGGRVREVSIFYGSDFFLDTESMLYNSLERAVNPIERKNILVRINQNRYRGNENKLNRQTILYDLIPYVSDKDFDYAVAKGVMDETTFEYQTRFSYWISQFEAKYGDIVTFYNSMEEEKPQKLNLINKLILGIINSFKTVSV